jgi:hypothetical protein
LSRWHCQCTLSLPGQNILFIDILRTKTWLWYPVWWQVKGTVQRKLRGVESYINLKDFVSHWTADILF